MEKTALELVTRTFCDRCGEDITWSNSVQVGDTELCTTCSCSWDDYKKTFRREADVVRCRDWAASGKKQEVTDGSGRT